MADTPAQRQADANAEVERVAAALYTEVWNSWPWEQIAEERRQAWRAHARNLLASGVIRPGLRERVEPPMQGQTTIEEALDELSR
jgi:hypothetical protein